MEFVILKICLHFAHDCSFEYRILVANSLVLHWEFTPSEITTYIMPMNNCTKFGALDRSVTIWHKIGHKQPDYIWSSPVLSCMVLFTVAH